MMIVPVCVSWSGMPRVPGAMALRRYWPDRGPLPFGVYGEVVHPGRVVLGDRLEQTA